MSRRRRMEGRPGNSESQRPKSRPWRARSDQAGQGNVGTTCCCGMKWPSASRAEVTRCRRDTTSFHDDIPVWQRLVLTPSSGEMVSSSPREMPWQFRVCQAPKSSEARCKKRTTAWIGRASGMHLRHSMMKIARARCPLGRRRSLASNHGRHLDSLVPQIRRGALEGGPVHQSAPGLSASSAVRDAHLPTSWQARGTMRPGEGGRGLKHHDDFDHAVR